MRARAVPTQLPCGVGHGNCSTPAGDLRHEAGNTRGNRFACRRDDALTFRGAGPIRFNADCTLNQGAFEPRLSEDRHAYDRSAARPAEKRRASAVAWRGACGPAPATPNAAGSAVGGRWRSREGRVPPRATGATVQAR